MSIVNLAHFVTVNRQGSQVKADLATAGTLAIGGGYYNHVLIAAGYGGLSGNPLTTQEHQVTFYAALTGNSWVNHVDGFVSGFETGLGVDCVGTCNVVSSFQVGGIAKAGTSTITRTIGLGTHDETVGTHNAAIADNGAPAFTGNWFIYYVNTRPSWLGGALTIGSNFTCGGNIILAASHDIDLPGGGFGITNGVNRFIAVASGASPLTTFAYPVKTASFAMGSKTPVASVTAPAAAGATYTAAEQTTINAIRTALINVGVFI